MRGSFGASRACARGRFERRNRRCHIVEDQGRYPDGSHRDHRAVAGAIDLAPDRGRPRSGEGSAEPYLLQNKLHRLQHPDSRHRHTGDFGDDRSCGGGRVQRHSLYPQSLLRTGILRRQSGRSGARSARHALRPQCDGRRGERDFGKADGSVRSHAVGRLGQLSQPPLRRHGQYSHRGRPSRSARCRRMDQARRLHAQPDDRQANRWPRSVVEPRDAGLEAG